MDANTWVMPNGYLQGKRDAPTNVIIPIGKVDFQTLVPMDAKDIVTRNNF